MVRSMTGFGRYENAVNGYHIIAEIRSVNHRYFEYSSRITRSYSFLDDKVKAYLKEYISRGKVDVFLSIDALEDPETKIELNHSLASGYVKALRELAGSYGLQDDVTVSTLARYPDIFMIHKSPEDEDIVWAAVSVALEKALRPFLEMRTEEGKRMKADVLQRAQAIMQIVAQIEDRSPQTVAEYREKLLIHLKEVLADTQIEQQRVLTEAAIFADKVAVAEETVRLRSHYEQFCSFLEADEAVGRKLDFIVQEMNRETNTIGSKAQDAAVAHMVVDMKAELEKIREQIQNIE